MRSLHTALCKHRELVPKTGSVLTRSLDSPALSTLAPPKTNSIQPYTTNKRQFNSIQTIYSHFLDSRNCQSWNRRI